MKQVEPASVESTSEPLSEPLSESLSQWINTLTTELAINSGLRFSEQGLQLSPLAGDAGFRRYYRVNTCPESLLVDAPQDSGKSESATYFAELSSILRCQHVNTPAIYACDGVNNRLLIESFGSTDLLDVLSPDTVDGHYANALFMLLKLQQVPASALKVPTYDDRLLRQEMALFPEWFASELLGYDLSPEERVLFDELCDVLIAQALEQPQVLVHRDYHSRNLMYQESAEIGVIDFQDAVWGPITYDLASLLRDCYVRWSPKDVQRWALAYGEMAHNAGVIPAVSPQQFLQWFDLMGLQRHIKVLGIFARLNLRDGKSRYLNDLPLVIRYVLEVAQQYPQAQGFAIWFEKKLLPIAIKQPWYRDHTRAGDK
ncbi:putative phosphotransferase [gamma proteobacterium IMCC1989]|nr:putative phosphotransferase [gamma proteobacterium IMCC1989]